jgi:hypothetical protein
MGEKIFWALVGALVMRYIILNTPDYRAKEAEKVDEIRNKVHDLIKKYSPESNDEEVGNDVLSTFPGN